MGQIGYFFNLIITFPILNVLMLLYYIVGDFALAIILLTIVIRLIMFPLTLKQLKSTKAMQQIQPLIADVKKQYPKDQRAQLEATQAIYKEYGINPAAGCLPLLVQLPVLYGLYFALRSVVSGGTVKSINDLIYPFLPKLPAGVSIASLTDFRWFTFINPAWHIPLSMADPTHILPILAALATFVQLRMSQPRNVASGPSNAMANQMKIMQYIMPFFTLFIAWGFPAGLALYWTTSSIFSMVQQYFVTGWGSLFSVPSLGGAPKGESKAYVGDTRKEKELLGKVVDSNAEILPESSSRTNGYNSSSARRRRPNSASARRRGNATPRRNPSRS